MAEKTPQDIEFEKKLAQATYKTTYNAIGTQKSALTNDQKNGINGKFTNHLIYSGMYKNASLNTTGERDRWLSGSKDWMEKLG